MQGDKVAKITLVIGVYWFLAISMIFVNKWLLGNVGQRDISLVIAWIQVLSTII